MWNAIPFIGWIISAGVAISMAIPFWIVWTSCHIGQKYFYFLPEVYKTIGFWDTVGLFIAMSIIKSVFIPTLGSHVNVGNKD